MTLSKVQPFCRTYRTFRQKNNCLYLHKNHFCVLWKLNRRTNFLDAVAEIENNLGYEETQINDNKLKQVVEYNFPISYEMNCLLGAFDFNLKTCNLDCSEDCEA